MTPLPCCTGKTRSTQGLSTMPPSWLEAITILISVSQAMVIVSELEKPVFQNSPAECPPLGGPVGGNGLLALGLPPSFPECRCQWVSVLFWTCYSLEVFFCVCHFSKFFVFSLIFFPLPLFSPLNRFPSLKVL